MHQGKGVRHPPGAIGCPKGGQGLHLGIYHPEPPIVAHWGLPCWFLPLQRVCKGESKVQAVSWLCLTGGGGHVKGCVCHPWPLPGTGIAVRDKFCITFSRLPLAATQGPFAFLSQHPLEAAVCFEFLGPTPRSVCTAAWGDTSWMRHRKESARRCCHY